MSSEKSSGSAGGRIVSVIQSVFIYGLSIAIIIGAILFAMDKSPQKSLFGYRYYTVLTPSMTPTYQVGDVVVVKLTDASNISVGDVITFNPSSESDAYLTHRVAEVYPDYSGTGITCFRTKGDANDTEDSFLVDESRVIGTVVFHVPKIGYIVRFVQLKWYFVLPLIALLFLWIKLLKMYFASGQENAEQCEGEQG